MSNIIAWSLSASYITVAVAFMLSVVPFKVTVVYRAHVCLGRISSRALFAPATVYIRIVDPPFMKDHVALVSRGNYSITWCYGWKGKSAAALRTLVALTS